MYVLYNNCDNKTFFVWHFRVSSAHACCCVVLVITELLSMSIPIGVPPSNTSLSIIHQHQIYPASSSSVTVHLEEDEPQEFKCLVSATRPEAYIEWSVEGVETLPPSDVVGRSSNSSGSLVDTISTFRFVPSSAGNHLQRVRCRTVLPVSGVTVQSELILLISSNGSYLSLNSLFLYLMMLCRNK